MALPNSSTYRMADRLAGGELAAIILGRRAEGISLDRIRTLLAVEHGIEVSRPTLANWLDELAPAADAEAAAS